MCQIGSVFKDLEVLIHPREVETICSANELQNCLKLFVKTKPQHIGIMLGFPCGLKDPIIENDGLFGGAFLSRVLLSLGFKVTWISEDSSHDVLEKTIKASILSPFFDSKKLQLQTFPAGIDLKKSENSYKEILTDMTHCFFIERPGRNIDGKYHTMSGREITPVVAPLDEYFYQKDPATEHLITISMCDGIDEVGMGNLDSKVAIPQHLASVVQTDGLIVSSVSDWAVMSFSMAYLALLNTFVVDVSTTNDVVMLDTMTKKNLSHFFLSFHEVLKNLGVTDGVTGDLRRTISSIPLESHLVVYNKMIDVISGDNADVCEDCKAAFGHLAM